jgi:hypothetical protein
MNRDPGDALDRGQRRPVIQVDPGHRVLAVVVAQTVDVVILHQEDHRDARVGEDLAVGIVQGAPRVLVRPDLTDHLGMTDGPGYRRPVASRARLAGRRFQRGISAFALKARYRYQHTNYEKLLG